MDSVTFIPTTIRDYKCTLEIDFINAYNPQFLICTNGSQIYINGELDLEWEERMRKLIIIEEVESLYNKVLELKSSAFQILNIGDFYIKVRFKCVEEANKWVEKINELVYGDFFTLYQGKNIFIMNKNLKKVDAVKHLIKKFNFKDIYTAGDSEPDEEFTGLEGVKTYLPKHATFTHKKAFVTSTKGIEATDEILEKILKDIDC